MSLSNTDLIIVSKKLKLQLITVCMRDEIVKKEIQQGLFIVNMDTSNHSGTHWVAIIVYEEYDGFKSIYMDSFGLAPPQEIIKWLHKIQSKIPYNNKQIQAVNTTECGWYCLSICYYIQYKRTDKNILDAYNEWISKFSNNTHKNLIILRNSFLAHFVNFYKKCFS